MTNQPRRITHHEIQPGLHGEAEARQARQQCASQPNLGTLHIEDEGGQGVVDVGGHRLTP